MEVKSQSSMGSGNTLGQLVAYGGMETLRFCQLESAINALPAHNVLKCLDHHLFYGGHASANADWPIFSETIPNNTTVKDDVTNVHEFKGDGVTIGSNDNAAAVNGGLLDMVGTDSDGFSPEELLDDCRLAQHATNGFSFALISPWRKLLHIFNDKMVISRKQDGILYMAGMNVATNPGTIVEQQMTDPLVTHLFNALDQGYPVLPGESVGSFQRSITDLGMGSSLQTSTTPILIGNVLKGFVMGLSIKTSHEKKK
jgi:hypothetical protein